VPLDETTDDSGDVAGSVDDRYIDPVGRAGADEACSMICTVTCLG
jgi:hypothetical protein